MTERQQLARQLRTLLDDPASDLGDIDEVYIRLIADQLIQMAHEGHKREGRGAVVIDMRGIDVRTAKSNLGAPMYYLSITRADEHAIVWPASNVVEEVQGYAPDQECVIVMHREEISSIFVVVTR